jgi:hypothetical protein
MPFFIRIYLTASSFISDFIARPPPLNPPFVGLPLRVARIYGLFPIVSAVYLAKLSKVTPGARGEGSCGRMDAIKGATIPKEVPPRGQPFQRWCKQRAFIPQEVPAQGNHSEGGASKGQPFQRRCKQRATIPKEVQAKGNHSKGGASKGHSFHRMCQHRATIPKEVQARDNHSNGGATKGQQFQTS